MTIFKRLIMHMIYLIQLNSKGGAAMNERIFNLILSTLGALVIIGIEPTSFFLIFGH